MGEMRSNRKHKGMSWRDSRRWKRIGVAGRIKILFSDFTNNRIYKRWKNERKNEDETV